MAGVFAYLTMCARRGGRTICSLPTAAFAYPKLGLCRRERTIRSLIAAATLAYPRLYLRRGAPYSAISSKLPADAAPEKSALRS